MCKVGTANSSVGTGLPGRIRGAAPGLLPEAYKFGSNYK